MRGGHNKYKKEASNNYPSVDSNHNYDWRLTTVNILLQKQMPREQNPFMWVIVYGAQAISFTTAFTEWRSFYHQKQQHDLDLTAVFQVSIAILGRDPSKVRAGSQWVLLFHLLEENLWD